MPAFASLCCPGELYLHHSQETHVGSWTKLAYQSAGVPEKLVVENELAAPEKVVRWLLR
jgi:hypothetical protein